MGMIAELCGRIAQATLRLSDGAGFAGYALGWVLTSTVNHEDNQRLRFAAGVKRCGDKLIGAGSWY